MKTTWWKTGIAVTVILMMALVSCEDYIVGINGQGEIVEETVYIDDIDGFVSTICADIYLTQGDRQEVVIKAQQNIIDNIELDRIDDGIWTIRYDRMVTHSKPVRIYITVPNLTRAAVSGSGSVEGQTPFKNLDRLKLLVSGSGSIELDAECESMDALISGSGNMHITGTAEDLDLVVSGSGDFGASGLVTKRSEITISGSGNARITAEEFLRVLISGSGDVYYLGDPDLDVHVSGSGNVLRIR